MGEPAKALDSAEDSPRIGKSAVERNRKWLHLSVWPALFLTVLLTKPSFENSHVRILLGLLSYVLVTVGAVGRLWCGLYLFGRKSKLVCQEGPYSVCRNPLYLSAFLSIVGLAVATQRLTLMIVVPIVMGIYYWLVIKAEEGRLEILFGREYQAYYARTPRFLPRLKNYRSPETLVVDPDHYARGIVKAMGYFWLLLLLQLAESL